MNKWLKLFAVTIFILVLSIIYIVLHNAPSVSIPDNVKVVFDRDIIQQRYSESLAAGTIQSITPSFTPTPGILNSQKPMDENQRKRILVRDFFDEEIKEASLKIGNQILNTTNSVFDLEGDHSGISGITVQASGYSELSIQENLSDKSVYTARLEYESDYDIYVDNLSTNEDGASIHLYEMDSIDRETINLKKQRIRTGISGIGSGMCTLANEDNAFRIDRSHEPCFGLQQEIPAGTKYETNPRINDILLSFSGTPVDAIRFNHDYERDPRYIYLESIPSQRLRIWDSLFLSEKSNECKGIRQKIYFARDNHLLFSTIHFPLDSSKLKRILSIPLNGKKQCRLTGLKPGLYFVQAVASNGRSQMLPLFPAVGGCRLSINSHSRLIIETAFDNISKEFAFPANYIPDVQLTLTGMENGIHTASAKTNVIGRAEFDRIPFGLYRLQAVPPDNDLHTIEREVLVDRSPQKIRIAFPVETYEISGSVKDIHSNEPIRHYPVMLEKKNNGGFYQIGFTDTGSMGEYHFCNLPSGEYRVNHVVNEQSGKEYWPILDNLKENEYLITEIDDNTGQKFGKNVHLTDKNAENVDLFVSTCVRTTLSGKVINQNNHPIQEALVQVSAGGNQLLTSGSRVFTDENGEFVFDVLCYPQNQEETVHASIRAAAVDIIPSQMKDIVRGGKVRGQVLVSEKIVPLVSTEKSINFKIGHPFKGITLVLEDSQRKTLQGSLITEDGYIPDETNIEIIYDDLVLPVEIDREGKFSIQYNFQHEFSLNVGVSIVKAFMPLVYDSVETVLLFPDDKDYMYVQITLKKSAFIQGHVVNENREDVDGATVVLQDARGKEYQKVTFRGSFFFYVPGDGLYNLYIKTKDNQLIPYPSKIDPNNSTELEITLKTDTNE